MDSPEVNAMLEGAQHIRVRYNDDMTHGAFLLNKAGVVGAWMKGVYVNGICVWPKHPAVPSRWCMLVPRRSCAHCVSILLGAVLQHLQSHHSTNNRTSSRRSHKTFDVCWSRVAAPS